MMAEKSINNITKIITVFIFFMFFTFISFFIVKKMDSVTSDGLLYAIINIPNLIAESIVESINNELILRNVIISQQSLENITFALKTYWMSSTLSGYCVATCFLGSGLFETPFKIVFCPVISPLVMPIIIIIAVISFIKNIVFLVKPVHTNTKSITCK